MNSPAKDPRQMTDDEFVTALIEAGRTGTYDVDYLDTLGAVEDLPSGTAVAFFPPPKPAGEDR